MDNIMGVIIDFRNTAYDPKTKALTPDCLYLLDCLIKTGRQICLIGRPKFREEKPEQAVRRFEIEYLFTHIINKKTDLGEALRACAKEMNLWPDQVLVVGDRMDKEIATAKALGMKTAWLKSEQYSERSPKNSEEQPDLIISQLTELAHIFKIPKK